MTRTNLSVTPMATLTGTRYGYRYDRLLVSRSNRRDRHGRFATGGNFLCSHEEVSGDMSWWPSFSHLGLSSTPGPICHSAMPFHPPTAPTYLIDADSHFQRLAPFGAVGFKRARPGNPSASNLVTLVEFLREGAPRDPQVLLYQLRTLKDLGSLHLALQFGWLPLLADIRRTWNTALGLSRALRQFRRNNGRRQRRRRVLLDTTSTTTTVSNNLVATLSAFSSLPNYWAGWINWQAPSLVVTDTVTTKRWFSGAFTHYIPDIETPRFSGRAELALFGQLPTPSVVWDALPWSWLVDWFTNAGDVFSNLSWNALTNQTADYAYIMESKTSVRTSVATVVYEFGGQSGTAQVSLNTRQEYRSRLQASPLGFGFTWEGISPSQAGILAALAASRGRR